MRTIAAVPATGLLAGAAAGLLLPSLPAIPTFAILMCSGALSVWAWRAAHGGVLALVVAGGFFAGGALLSADAWQRAWRPPLRVAFEQLARQQRAQAVAEGRRLPEDDEAFVVVEGELRADAARTESGVSLSVAIDRVEGQEGQEGQDGQDRREGQERQERQERQGRSAKALAERASGGVAVTVTGSLAAGTYCVEVVDVGNAAGPIAYTVTVAHT